MTLLRQLQNDAIDHQVSVTTLFRKARILAARLKNKEFEQWIKYEMDGYPNDVQPPSYRIVDGHAKADLIIGIRPLPDADIMVSFLPEEFRAWGDQCTLRQSVSHLLSLLEGLEGGKHPGLQCPWPQELAAKYGGKGYGDGRYNRAQCLRAWQEISPASVVAVVETARNKLLEFVLQIEAEAPDAGEAMPDQLPLAQDKVTQIFQTFVSGGVANIGAKESHGVSNTANAELLLNSQIQQGSNHSTQTGTFSVGTQERADLEKLARLFEKHLDELNLDQFIRKKATIQIATIQAQLEDENPDVGIISQAGKILRTLTEGVVSGLIGAAIQPAIWQWVRHAMATYFPK